MNPLVNAAPTRNSAGFASSRVPGERRGIAIILLCAAIAALPFAVRGNSCGHDFDFHLQSWLSAAQHWQQGVPYPHWVSAANYDTGEPRLVFYPPASWTLGALLGLVLPWNAVPGTFILVTFAACGLSLYRLAREWLPRDAATFAAVIYIVNPYALFVAYERGAFGEMLAGVWLPLIVLFGLRRKAALLPLTLCVAAVWLTNAPAAVMGSYLLAVLAAIAAVTERAWWPVLRAAGGAALGMGLAAFYIAPAAYERRWVQIARAVNIGMRPQDSFLFGHTGDDFHDGILKTVSWVAVSLLAATAVAGFAAWGALRRRPGAEVHSGQRLPRRVRIALIAGPAMVLFLLLPVSAVVWRHVPQLEYLQFPWRWLLVLSIVLAMLSGVATTRRAAPRAGTTVRNIRTAWTHWTTWAAPLLAVALAVSCSKIYWQPCDQDDIVSAQISVFHGIGVEGTDEYTTPGTDNDAIQQGLPPVRVLNSLDADEADSAVETNPDWPPDKDDDDGRAKLAAVTVPAAIDLRSWQDERKAFTVKTSRPAFAVLRLLDYPAWEVRMNGTLVPLRPHRADGLMALPLAAGVSTIEVRYRTTPDVRWGRAISLAAVVIFLLLALRQKRRRGRHDRDEPTK